MSIPSLPWEGGCRCGQVRFKVSAPPLLTMACHCTGCQQMTSSAYSLSAAIPADGFEVTKGEPVIGGLHGATRHFFCPYCMSWMFTRAEGLDWFVNIRATLLDDHGWYEPFAETMTAEGLPWAKTPAVHSFEGFPPLETYQGLTAEFAEKMAAG
jgi:hypothetical protein